MTKLYKQRKRNFKGKKKKKKPFPFSHLCQYNIEILTLKELNYPGKYLPDAIFQKKKKKIL